jgi:hypothetical protein
VVADPLGQRLGQLSPGAVVGQQAVTARLLHSGGERPRPGHLHLEPTAVVRGELLHHVEVLRQQRPSAPVVDPRGSLAAGESPPGGLEVGVELGQDRQGAARHAGVDATIRQLGQVREVGELAEDDAHHLVVLRPGHGTDSRSDAHGLRRSG